WSTTRSTTTRRTRTSTRSSSSARTDRRPADRSQRPQADRSQRPQDREDGTTVAAPAGHLKVSRYFLVLGIILAALYALVFFTGSKKPHPKLGLDLQGGAAITLSALTADGNAPSAESLDQARQIIANRVNASGVSEPEVVTEGNRNLVVSVAGGTNQDDLKKLVAPAKLTFRKVLQTTQDQPAPGPLPDTSCGASLPGARATASPSASASGSAKPSTSASAGAAPAAAPPRAPP